MVMSPVIERETIKFESEDELNSKERKFWHEFNRFTRSKIGRPYLEGKLYEDIKEKVGEFLDSPQGCWFDAGCGNLPASKWILEKARRNIRIWAGDINIDGANEVIGQIKDGHLITIVHTDLRERWPFPNNFFDGIIGNHVFTFLTKSCKTGEETNGVLKEVLQEAYRVLKPGGILIWTTPKKNANTLQGLLYCLRYLLDPSRWRKHGHSLFLTALKTMKYTREVERKSRRGIYNLLEKEECEKILHSIGFTDLEWRGIFAGQSWLNRAKKPAY